MELEAAKAIAGGLVALPALGAALGLGDVLCVIQQRNCP